MKTTGNTILTAGGTSGIGLALAERLHALGNASTPTYSATKAAVHSYTESLREQLRDTSVRVVELAPPYPRTALMGDRQASDEHAMPLDEYADETISLLQSQPDAEPGRRG